MGGLMRVRGRFARLRAVRRQRRFAREDFLRVQGAELRSLVRHAYDRVPFYRELYDRAGLAPESVRDLEDLDRVPFATRDDLQGQPLSRIAAKGVDPGDLRESRTSGSTGEPLVTRRLSSEGRLQGMHRLEAFRHLGMRRRDKLAVVSHMPEADRGARPPLLRLLGALGLYRYQLLHSVEQIDTIAERIVDGRPRVIVGITEVLHDVARSRHASALAGLGVRFVAPGGQKLSASMREQMERSFGARVYDCYAAQETGLIAWECPQTGDLHTCDGKLIVEVLRDGRPAAPGEQGEVVATALHARSVPFIRYPLGDLVTVGPAPCACGAPFGTIREIVGRHADFLQLPDGRIIHPGQIQVTALKDSFDWIRRCQYVQERRDLVCARIVPRVRPTEAQRSELDRNMRAVLGPDVELRLELVDDLGLEGTERFKTVVSKVRPSNP
ncbi:MAG: phenylacetate--CoA ligase family protein [Planctomycetota bacterium]|jgi:phenylacetate-CoA ligase